MSELYLEIISNSALNKNTSTLVESYLLDPPVLPFLKELKFYTKGLYSVFNEYIYYQNIAIDTITKFPFYTKGERRCIRHILRGNYWILNQTTPEIDILLK